MPDVRNSVVNKMDIVLTWRSFSVVEDTKQYKRDSVIPHNGDGARSSREYGESS